MSLVNKIHSLVTGWTQDQETTNKDQATDQSTNTDRTHSAGDISSVERSRGGSSENELTDEEWQRLRDQSIDYGSERY